MKIQMGVLVVALALVNTAMAAVSNISTIHIEQQMAKEKISRAAFEGKTSKQILIESGTHINAFAKWVGSSPEIVAQNLARKPELLESYLYVDMVSKRLESDPSNVSAADKENMENNKIVLGNYGIAKGIKAEDMAVAKLEAPAVQKFAEIFPRLVSYGPKAVEMGKVFALEVKAGLTLNKALRSAAKRVLGLDGEALEKFMRDPNEGLANCKA